ncbi:hypothetical protein OvHV-2gp28 [Ovine gammaherpesvirus 2]|uniref:Uncharacterized protein n=1 Tax=Ovine gammaherpesvirus 2 TaxID=10398 RepID=A1BM19_9GAMA|nr:hypothetical protein OvHV-2gp28 [Ovine gammaherpesvirus 2]
MCARSGQSAVPKPGAANSHQCDFTKMITMATTFHGVDYIYICPTCARYHVCDGGHECAIVTVREGLVCELTGRCVADSVTYGTQGPNSPRGTYTSENHCSNQSFENVVSCVQQDVAFYFSNSAYEEVKMSVLAAPCELCHEVSSLIKTTFKHCQDVFRSAQCAYSLICSIYIHVIISVYSSKTVYGNLIFKCTKNKKFDSVAKSIRQAWMSTLTTGDICGTAAM